MSILTGRCTAAASLSGVGLLSLIVGVVPFATATSASAAGSAGGNVAIGWSIPKTPAAGLTNITFPMTVNPATLRANGTYFAQQYDFAHAFGYTGLQPRADLNGHQRLRAVFSTFTGGSTSTDPNCHNGADGGAGVSCGAEFDTVYGHTYNVTVAKTGTDTWTGTATDTVTGTANHIGSWTLPAGSGNLQSGQAGFVEYYEGSPTCAELPSTDVLFGAPTSTDSGGLTGSSTISHEYSGCIGQANYHATAVGGGAHITRGWITQPGTPTTPAPSNSNTSTKPTTPDPTPVVAGSAQAQPSHTATQPASPSPEQPAGNAAIGSTATPGNTPSSTTTDGGSLASTGGGSTRAGVIGAALIAAGGSAVFLLRRRRTQRKH
ncbi:DUF3472 domain-containing protein [Kitasatospora sp. NPDC057015]|uniref:DUF3472 domain-containing protein n=1 Tax=Kitasatospora sp. NPDC057015 TaxID=3346001 RepID=UPI00362DEA09